MLTTRKPAIMQSQLTTEQELDTMESTTGMLITILVVMEQLDMPGMELTTGMVVKLTESMPTTTQPMETMELDTPKCTMLPPLFLLTPQPLSTTDMPLIPSLIK